ncbi:MAG: TerB family tellurite resistance protein [Candidatus Poseidoniales archaeon]|nr:MAG: TerB family tellurite resistance protein [Candidatus Poseidoniales archaeon]
MLPDTVHKLPRDERFAYARLLAFMTRVDNELTVDEMAMFEQRLGTALLSPIQRKSIRNALKTPPSLEECLEGMGEETARLALRDATLMASADGNVDDDEKEVLQSIIEYFGWAPESMERLLKWTSEGYLWMQQGYDILNEISE